MTTPCPRGPVEIVHWVDGSPAGTTDRWADVTNPATGRVTGRVALAERGRRRRRSSPPPARAARGWATTSLARRTQVLFAFRELLNARKDELAAIITAEHGKVLSDALGEVARGQEVVEFACGIPHLLKGGHSENASTGVDVHSHPPAARRGRHHQPRSTSRRWCRCGSSPSPSPPATPSCSSPARRTRPRRCWMAAAVEGGRPARRRLQRAAGRQGRRRRAADHPDVKAISFVGSTPIAQYVYEHGTAHGKRVQALGGAKNHMVVLPDADLDLAADAAVNAGFGSAGERCMAICVLVAVGADRRRAGRQDRRAHRAPS